MSDREQFTDDELAFGEEHPVLGPDYKRARDIADRFMADFKDEHFKPLVDEFAKVFADKLWGDVSAWFIADTESNLQGEIRRLAESSVFALLHGHRGYAERYVLGDGFQAEKVREAIFEQFKDELIDKGIQERDAEIARLKETIGFMR